MNEKEYMLALRKKAETYLGIVQGNEGNAFEAQELMYQMLSPFVVIDLVNAWLEVETEGEK